MKTYNPLWKRVAGLMAVILALVGAAVTVSAATTALSGQVTQRPLTPTEISTYKLTNAQFSAGIGTVALGEPVYLDAMVSVSIAPSNIISVTWSLPGTNKPVGSLAGLLTSPLGTNVPLFKTGDRVTGGASGTPSPLFQLAGPSGRTFFRPDVAGQYTVLATITTTGVNGTNTIGPVTTNIATTITAATYLGINTCAACHSGNFQGVPSIYPTYTNTPHASFFTRAIDGLVSSSLQQKLHSVSYAWL